MRFEGTMVFLKRSKVKSIGVVMGSLVLILAYQNCAKPFVNGSGSMVGLSEQDIIEEKAMKVLVSKCSSCHSSTVKSGGVDVMDINEMLALGVIIPGEPSLSLVFTQIQGGAMPPSSALAQADIEAVYNWIADGFKGGTTVTPITPPTPTVPVALEAKYASIYTKILEPKCLGCHNANSRNGVNFATYTGTMNTVQRTLPLSSSLYTSVATRKTMPKSSGFLTTAENKAIFDWITAGALNN
jgi:mono/diheme cytochrome c family protein